jgi:uncharacterized protein (TIGR04255 family)
MRFPESARIVFETETLEQVICQVRFPQVLAIGTKPPDGFQEIIRGDYPRYSKQSAVGAPPELSQLIDQFPMMSGPEAITHWFASPDDDIAISLGTNFVAVTAKRYPGWGGLRAEVDKALGALEEAYAPAFYERVGLRYHDVVNRAHVGLEDSDWADLMNPALVSLLGAGLGIDPDNDQIFTSALLHLDEPENALVHLRHGVGRNSEHSYDLDADFYIENQAVERGIAVAQLDTLNREEGNLFRWAITDRLRDALGVREQE